MRYPVILLDPPWPYDRKAGQGVAGQHYSLMTWPDIHALGEAIRAVAAEDAGVAFAYADVFFQE